MSRKALDRTLREAEFDGRLLAMLAGIGALWLGLDVATDGIFLSPRNLVNLAVQTSAVGVMATGMVLVIVARHIDLSVGSVLGFTGMLIAVLQVPEATGLGPLPWPAALAIGLGAATAIGVWHGAWTAYAGLPAFIVTLAGLLIFRGAAWLVTDGRTVAPLDETYQRLGGGLNGSIGLEASWAIAGVVIALGIALRFVERRRRTALGIPVRPRVWEGLAVLLTSGALFGFVAVTAAAASPSGATRGVPIPVFLLGGIALGVHFLARRTRFGRYVFAIGGNPLAARLAGIDVRRVSVAVFALMGLLSGVAAVLTTARLGAGTNSLGTLAELQVIAAAVIGGTSLAGGVGSVGGAVLGALLMQSLENGMVLLGVTSALRQVAIGLILLAAVGLDARWRARE